MNAPVQMPPRPASPIDRLDVFSIAERVVAQGAYARFSSVEQLAVCLWVLDRRPRPGELYSLTILAEPDPSLDAGAQAARMNEAHRVAGTILAGGSVSLPAGLRAAIVDLLAAEDAINANRNAFATLTHREDRRRAIGALRTAFSREGGHGHQG